MKGKREAKREKQEQQRRYMFENTDPLLCTCGHRYLPAMWHLGSCPLQTRLGKNIALINCTFKEQP